MTSTAISTASGAQQIVNLIISQKPMLYLWGGNGAVTLTESSTIFDILNSEDGVLSTRNSADAIAVPSSLSLVQFNNPSGGSYFTEYRQFPQIAESVGGTIKYIIVVIPFLTSSLDNGWREEIIGAEFTAADELSFSVVDNGQTNYEWCVQPNRFVDRTNQIIYRGTSVVVTPNVGMLDIVISGVSPINTIGTFIDITPFGVTPYSFYEFDPPVVSSTGGSLLNATISFLLEHKGVTT